MLATLVFGFVAVNTLKAQDAADSATTAPAKAAADDSSLKILNTGGEPKYTFSGSYPPGKYRMAVTVDMKMKQGAAVPDEEGDEEEAAETPQIPAMEMKMEMGMIMTVGKFDENDLQKTTMQYDLFKMDNPMFGEIMVTAEDVEKKEPESKPTTSESQPAVDQNNPTAMIKDMYAKMMNMKFEIVQNRQGEIVELVMPEMEQLAADNPMMAMSMENVKRQFANQIREYSKMGKENMPDVKVGVGASWINIQKIPVPMIGGDFNVDAKSTLDAVKDTPAGKMAIIKTQTKMDLGDIQAASQPAIATFKKFSATMDGTTEYNIDKQVINKTSAKGKMQIVAEAGPQGEMSMDMDVNVTATVTEVK